MPQTTVAADVDEASDVAGHLPAQVTLGLVILVYDLSDTAQFRLREVLDPGILG
jgi:hypothetical protein